MKAISSLIASGLVAATLAFGGAACGGGDRQVQIAKAAQYDAPSDQVLDIALETAKAEYKIGPVEPQNHRFSTEPQFYSPEGGRESPRAGGFVNMREGSIQLTMVVEVVPTDGGHVAVVVTPVTFQVIQGSPKPRELKPNDPYLPGWVSGRVDTLATNIYDHAKSLVVPAGSAAAGSAAAPAAPAPTAAPDEPAAGSDAAPAVDAPAAPAP